MSNFVADRESAGKLAVSVKTSQYQRPRLCGADEALSVCQSAPEYHLGPRWYEAGADRESAPYRYWCAVDFDGDGKRRGIAALVRPFRDAERFAREELEGLTVSEDYVIGPSGRKGRSYFFAGLPRLIRTPPLNGGHTSIASSGNIPPWTAGSRSTPPTGGRGLSIPRPRIEFRP